MKTNHSSQQSELPYLNLHPVSLTLSESSNVENVIEWGADARCEM